MLLRVGLNREQKLNILADDSKYDIACACGDKTNRKRSDDNNWIYPVTMASGRRTFLFRTLLSNVCTNNCKYCALRTNHDTRRCGLSPNDIADMFLEYYNSRKVSGLFLSSGIIGTPDNTMALINDTGKIIRRRGFRGYMHLKIIPGASNAAINETLGIANAVSLNIETPGEKNFSQLCTSQNYIKDIASPMKFISETISNNYKFSNVQYTTQFIVGAASETDLDIIKYSWRLYKKLRMNRIYFNAYQRGLGEKSIPGENNLLTNNDMLVREHRLYQVDWLIRKYKFSLEDIPLNMDGNLDLTIDPKELWARRNPDFFPINVNTACFEELLRVPGIGFITAKNILHLRKNKVKINSVDMLGKIGKRLGKVSGYIRF